MVVFGDSVSHAFHHEVIRLFHRIRAAGDPRIRNLHPAYASLLIDFDPLRMTHEELATTVEALAANGEPALEQKTRRIVLPVSYDLEFGPDLSAVAQEARLTVEEVIAAYCSAEYIVCFLGFSPGFSYLAGLPPQLAMPRHSTPRRLVAAGSVGIAGDQTGVYPVDSPGGWQIIGRTPLRMFQHDATRPTRLEPGDSVRFRSISRKEFDDILHSSGGPLA